MTEERSRTHSVGWMCGCPSGFSFFTTPNQASNLEELVTKGLTKQPACYRCGVTLRREEEEA